jgi:ribosomal protein S18 acetylase RimI-like enzyme
MDVTFQLLSPQYEEATQLLLRRGLESHWGEYHAAFNPDINELFKVYEKQMIVGLIDGEIVACGGWKTLSPDTVEFVRFSVSEGFQRQSIGSKLMEFVETHVRSLGFDKAILETTSSWNDAIGFYLSNGYEVTHEKEGDTYFLKVLTC